MAAAFIFFGSLLTFLAARAREISDLHKGIAALKDLADKAAESTKDQPTAIYIPTQKEIGDLGNLRFLRSSKMISRVTNLSLAIALGSALYLIQDVTKTYIAAAKILKDSGDQPRQLNVEF